MLNPFRLTLLLASPLRLVLECIVALLAACLFLVEARIPIVGDKVVALMKRYCTVGGRQWLDLDIARGRVGSLMVMAFAVGAVNYLNVAKSGGVSVGGAASIVEPTTAFANVTSSNATTIVGDQTMSTATTANATTNSTSANALSTVVTVLLLILQSAIFSPTMWILVSLSIYTMYIMRTFPEYAQWRAYSHVQSGVDTASQTTPRVAFGGGDNSGGTDVVGGGVGGGYQSVGSGPSWAQPLSSVK